MSRLLFAAWCRVAFTGALAALSSPLLAKAPGAQERQVLPFDGDWRFTLGDPGAAAEASYDDAKWAAVSLPHDWSIAGAFAETNPTGGAGAFLPAGIGWYRKHFHLGRAAPGQRVSLEFDGVMAHSNVWINGVHLGNRPYGYASFAYDITGFVRSGADNIVAVRADNGDELASRWYTGAGIYRHVRLVTTPAVHFAHWGVAVTTPVATGDKAVVHLEVAVVNDGERPFHGTVEVTLRDHAGTVVGHGGSAAVSLAPQASQAATVDIPLANPLLWDLDRPVLYRAQVALSGEPATRDATQVEFGIRDAHFDAATGFWLNGRNLKIKGVAIHADASALGVAVPAGAWEDKLKRLKEIGANAIRAAHNPFDPDFLELCDRMGFLVMDEMFDCWNVAKNPYDYSQDFTQWNLTDARDTVMRDRNHPSIILYSAGNEIHDTPQEEHSRQVLSALVAMFHQTDPSRPVTQALFRPNVSHDYDNGLADLLDVIGTNYRFNELIAAHVAKPSRRIIGTENGHEIRAWLAVRDVPSYAGEFIWTGIDYLGESPRWPQVSANSGLVDRIGDIRPVGRQFESWWSAEPMVAVVRRIAASSGTPTDPGFDAVKRRTVLFADWTPASAAPHPETVEVYSNCSSVELFLNGRSLGVKDRPPAVPPLPESGWTKARREDPSAHDPDAPRQWTVDYAPGTLEAIGHTPGQSDVHSILRTAGKAAALALVADATTLHPNWDSVGYVRATVVDAQGVRVPGATNAVTFSVESGTLVAVDSADNASHESFKGPVRQSFDARSLAIVRAAAGAKQLTVRATAEGLAPATASLPVR